MKQYDGVIVRGSGEVVTAHPKAYMGMQLPDPADPEWQKVAYMRYLPNGRVSALRMWEAQGFLNEKPHLWQVATQEEYEAYEAAKQLEDQKSAAAMREIVEARMQQEGNGQEAALTQLTERVDKLASMMEQLVALNLEKTNRKKKE